MEDDTPCRQINIELAVACNNLGKNVNPVCGLFSIDKDTGQLQFLSHTEVLRAASNPRFSKLLQCNFFPGRAQKLQLNIYSAPWNDEEDSDLSIHEEDRIGSILLSLDKVVPINDLNPKEFSALTVELPMWHDSDDTLNDRLMKQGAKMKIAFKASEHQPEGYFVEGPRADSNIHQALAIMLAGAEFLKYPFGSSGAPQKRFVWLEKNEGPMGTIYWCDAHKAAAKKKDKKKCIPIHTITGLFEQNQTDAFKKNKGKNLAKDRVSRCFSIVGKHRTLDLEARSKEIVDAFMMGIHRILSGSGFEVKEVGNRDKDELLSQASVKNTFVLRAKLRNLPAMPWSPDESNHTLIVMSEKQPSSSVFKSLEQSEWQKGNSNPNFEKALLLPFTIPPSNHPIKFTVYDHQLNDKHLLGAGVVRLDFFYRYVGQEMMVKLRNAYDPKIDQLLVDAGAYMLLTADTEIPLGGQYGMGNRSGYNSVVDEFRSRGEGGAEGGLLKPSRLRPLFAKSALAFMSAGVAVTVHHTDSKLAGSATLYYRNVDPYGQMVLCNEKSGDLHGMDKHGNPKDPLLTINMDHIRDCIVGIDHEKGYFASDKKKKAKKEHCMSIVYKLPDANDDKDKAKSKEASKKDATENKDASASTTTDAPKDGSTTTPADPSTAPQESPEVEENLISLDLELKDQGTRDAWATAIQEYLSSVMDSDEDEDLFEGGAGGKTGKRKRRLRKKVAGGKKLTESVAAEEGNKVAASLEKSFKPADITKLGKSLMDDDDDDGSADIDLFGKDPVRKKKAPTGPIEPPVMGDGAPMAPPMAPIMAPDMVIGAGAPPPPPPPGVPGAPPLFSAPVYNGPKLKHFHWEVLAPSEGAEGTLWKLIKDDLDKEGEELLEELFKQADLKALKKKDPAEDESKGIRLLEGKRAHNIEIVLKSFRMPNDAIRDSIYQVDTTILTVERIQALLSMVPNADEKKVLKNYLKSGKPVDKLGVAEQFALYMLEIPRIDTRLRLLLFQAKFDHIVEDMTMQYARLIKAGEQVRESKPLQKVMETILSVGNKLNRGTRTGGAQAFRLASLDKLNDTKSTDLKQTLLDFIVEYVYKHKRSEEEKETMPDPDDKAIEDGNSMAIPSYLDSIAQVKDAAQVDWQALNAEREMLLHGLQELSKEVELMNKEQEENGTSDQDRFPTVMSEFLEHAMKKAKKMKKKYLDAQDLIEGLFEYFGESENNFEPTEFFKLFDRFVFNYRQSEFKMFSKRLREKKEKARAAAKKVSEGEGGGGAKKGKKAKEGDNPATNIAAMLAQRRASIEGQTGKGGPKVEEEDDDEEWEDEEDEDGEYEDEEYEDEEEEEEEEEKKQPPKASEEKEAGKTVKVPGGATVAAGAAI